MTLRAAPLPSRHGRRLRHIIVTNGTSEHINGVVDLIFRSSQRRSRALRRPRCWCCGTSCAGLRCRTRRSSCCCSASACCRSRPRRPATSQASKRQATLVLRLVPCDDAVPPRTPKIRTARRSRRAMRAMRCSATRIATHATRTTDVRHGGHEVGGLRHVYEYTLHYRNMSLEEARETIHIREPFQNSTCMQCHSTAIRFWNAVKEHASCSIACATARSAARAAAATVRRIRSRSRRADPMTDGTAAEPEQPTDAGGLSRRAHSVAPGRGADADRARPDGVVDLRTDAAARDARNDRRPSGRHDRVRALPHRRGAPVPARAPKK